MAIVDLDPRDPTPIYAQLDRSLRAAIASGRLKVGEQLPTVRQLAVDLRVNPNTVAQAYRELERAGVVYVRRGQGSFVAQVSADDDDRRELAHGVAERALLEAHRNGLGVENLIDAIRQVAASRNLPILTEQT